MTTAKVFKSGNSQAVRLPKEFRLDCDEVEIIRRGDELVLREKPKTGTALFDVLTSLSDDFEEACREQPPTQQREAL